MPSISNRALFWDSGFKGTLRTDQALVYEPKLFQLVAMSDSANDYYTDVCPCSHRPLCHSDMHMILYKQADVIARLPRVLGVGNGPIKMSKEL